MKMMENFTLKSMECNNEDTLILPDELSVGLTNNSIQFSRAFLGYLEDVLRLYWPETEHLINESLTALFSAQLRHCKSSVDEPLFKNEVIYNEFLLICHPILFDLGLMYNICSL